MSNQLAKVSDATQATGVSSSLNPNKCITLSEMESLISQQAGVLFNLGQLQPENAELDSYFRGDALIYPKGFCFPAMIVSSNKFTEKLRWDFYLPSEWEPTAGPNVWKSGETERTSYQDNLIAYPISTNLSLLIQLWRDNVSLHLSDSDSNEFDRNWLKIQISYQDTLLFECNYVEVSA